MRDDAKLFKPFGRNRIKRKSYFFVCDGVNLNQITNEKNLPQLSLSETGSPAINISEVNREGITRVLFSRDPLLLEYLANTFFDSHIETSEDGRVELVPNTSVYKCPVCKNEYYINLSVSTTYRYCSGTKKNPHETCNTNPLNWNPILTQTGIYTLLGKTGGAMNTNIATANFGKLTSDIKANLTLDDRLMNSAFGLALGILATLIGNPKMYINPKLIEERTFDDVFNASFDMIFLINMTTNILSNSTKGKHMEAVKEAAENKIRTESEVQHRWDYPMPTKMNESKSLRERIGNIMGN